MKIAVIKLGARLVFGDKVGSSGGSGEAQSLVNMLSEAGAEVHCFTKILKDDYIPNDINIHQIEEEYSTVNTYDILIVINGTVNFFGGVADNSQILNYHMINNFSKKVIYIHCDPNLPLKQLWPSIKNRTWASDWKESDIVIVKKIDVVTQSTNITKVLTAFKDIHIDKIFQYDFQKFPMMFVKPQISEERIYTSDLSYGGTFRAGRREKKLIEFYFGYPEDLKVELFGKIKEEKFNPKKVGTLRSPNFSGPVDYNKMLHKMSESKAHVAIGDGHYPEFGMISQRVYESIMSDCVTFIDIDFDRNKRVFGDTELGKFLYVTNRDQVYKRLKMLTNSELNTIIKLQHKIVDFNRDTYCSDFYKLIQNLA